MLFDSTVRREVARVFGATLVVILTIVITMMLIRTLGLAAGGAVAPQDVVLLLGYTALGHLPTMLALSVFIAVVVALGRMYRDSEMTVWFASGVPLSRFIRPVLRVGWPILVAIGALVLLVWPWGNRSSAELRDRYEQRSDLSRIAPGVFQSSRDGTRVFFVERGSDASAIARNVFVLSNTANDDSVTSARSGRLTVQGDDRFVVLEQGQRNTVDRKSGQRTLAGFETYQALAGERVVQGAQTQAPQSMRTIDLMRRPAARNQGELTWRFGLLLGAANLLLMAIGLAATNPRRATNWNLLFALLGFVVYYNLVNLSQAWVSSDRAPMGEVLLALHGGAFLAALALIWWRDHATVAHLMRLRRPAATAV